MILDHTPRRRSGAPPDALDRHALKPDEALPADALWINLVEPSREEDRLVEAHLGISIPTRQEMADIEPSEILYQEDGVRYMTARIICRSDTALPSLADVSFILTDRALVTVRYDEPRSFTMFAARAVKPGGCGQQPEAVLDGLVETIFDRAADILGEVGKDIDRLSRSIFDRDREGPRSANTFRAALRSLGRKGDVISIVRESMVSIERLLLFLSASMTRPQRADGFKAEWRTALRDVQSIEEHATFLANKVQFLLDCLDARPPWRRRRHGARWEESLGQAAWRAGGPALAWRSGARAGLSRVIAP
jgi:magnesium transporter